MFVYKRMTQDGIRLVGEFLSDNGDFLAYAELLHKFNMSKFLKLLCDEKSNI